MQHLFAQLPPFYARNVAEAQAADGQVCPIAKVLCHDPVSIGQLIVQHMAQHSLKKPLKMVPKRSGSSSTPDLSTGGTTPRNFTEWRIRWEDMRQLRCHKWWEGGSLTASWVNAKLQDEATQVEHREYRGVCPTTYANKCQQRRQRQQDSRPRGDSSAG